MEPLAVKTALAAVETGARTVVLAGGVAANSALQLYQMTKALPRFPQWALFRDDQIVERGYHEPGLEAKMDVVLP